MSEMPDNVVELYDDPITNEQIEGTAAMLAARGSGRFPVGSPDWWFERMRVRLQAQRTRIRRPRAYYEGDHPLAFATDQWKKAFGSGFRAFNDNFMQIVVDSVDERLQVEGFLIPSADPDNVDALVKGDDAAWALWQTNGMDAESQLVHSDALVDGTSFVIVGPDGFGGVEITGESADEVVIEYAAGSRRRVAALKMWQADDGFVFATLYRPDGVWKWISAKAAQSLFDELTWVQRGGDERFFVRNDLGVVPVVPFVNRPRTLTVGRSEIDQLLPLQDAINKTFLDMLVAAEFSGFLQRYATGIEIPTDPETNQPQVDMLKMAIDRFLHVENPEAKFGTLDSTELANYTGSLAMQVQHLASRSSTPPHYFLAHGGNFPSGESLKAAETGLVSKVRRRMKHFGESWEAVIRLALAASGDRARAQAAVIGETIWRDPESRSESEHIDAISKMAALGVPVEILWEKSGLFTDTEIGRMKQLIAAGAPVATPSNRRGEEPPNDEA